MTEVTAPSVPLRFLSVNDVLARLAISRSLLLKLRISGNFPKEVRITGKRVGFIEAEIVAWMEGRIALRDQEATTHGEI
ncbi:AlpA family phage regulatory protein [Ochrobactrum pseudogrignonense]|uniref:AlpA family phage regulatory protein n=1 Tax=Brucella pseudogrignonensis TaxID=419475 RepID=A0A7Y3T1V3_9HYPH|nr:AlpA family phage regulatory protein [Brucella pseudogrignonensis]NNV19524.1 AlpA family phage regulatory protein [Brucella pseudogrignonensis]